MYDLLAFYPVLYIIFQYLAFFMSTAIFTQIFYLLSALEHKKETQWWYKNFKRWEGR